MSFEIHGIKEMRAKIVGIEKARPERIARALFVEGNIEMTEAKKRTPVDVDYSNGRIPPHPGQLRASGTVHPPETDGKRTTVVLSFGGGAVDYAIYVHEIIENFHPVGQAKYLESTLNESRPYMAQRLAERLKF